MCYHGNLVQQRRGRCVTMVTLYNRDGAGLCVAMVTLYNRDGAGLCVTTVTLYNRDGAGVCYHGTSRNLYRHVKNSLIDVTGEIPYATHSISRDVSAMLGNITRNVREYHSECEGMLLGM